MIKKIVFWMMESIFFLIVILFQGAFAQEKPFIIGMRIGCVTENWQMGRQEEGGFSVSEGCSFFRIWEWY